MTPTVVTPARAVTVVAAVLLSTTVVGRLPLPGSPPDLVLLVVVAVALAEGSRSGATTGFVAGVLADLGSDHALGRLALAYAVVGHLAGRLVGAERTPLVAVAAGAAGALLLYAGEGALVGDPRTSLHALGLGMVSSVPYTVVLAPLVVPLVGVLLRARPAVAVWR